MRLIKSAIERKTEAGAVTLMPEEPEDMWHAYNLLVVGDLLRASAIRKISTESASTGTRSVQRVHTTLTIRVHKLDFDAPGSQLHVSGTVAEENKHVKMGSFHTLDLELHRQFVLEKAEGGWDSIALETLKEAVSVEKKAQIWAVVMQEGLANVCLITEHQTVLRQRVELAVPKKRAGSSDHEKAVQRFFSTTLDTLLRLIDLAEPKPLLLASPGFTASGFQAYIKNAASTTGTSTATAKQLSALLPKITVAHSASAHLHSLAEVIASPAVTAKLSDAKFARETQLMEQFMTLLRADDMRAWYGPRESEAAAERGAVGKGGGVLLISNALFRAQDVAIRKRWVRLVDTVKDMGGEVRVLSSMHESGKRLDALGGVAVILTFPIENLDEEVAGTEEQRSDSYTDNGIEAPEPSDWQAHTVAEGRRPSHGEDIDL